MTFLNSQMKSSKKRLSGSIHRRDKRSKHLRRPKHLNAKTHQRPKDLEDLKDHNKGLASL